MAVVVAKKYELVRALGSGGLGAVFEARHLALGRRVAIKHLHRRYRDDPELCARFLREAQAAAAITHPGIVAVLDVDQDDDLGPVVVLELLEGDALDAALDRGPLAWPRAARIIVQALDAVGAAHARGVVHRDLKPGNLFLVREGGRERVKVLDFGIARIAARPALTATGQFVGTPRYASPEQLADASQADARSDVYSLGVTLLEMVAGEKPEPGARQAARADALAAMRANGAPEALCAVVARATEPDPAARYATAQAMRDALAEVLAGAGEALEPPPAPSDTPAAPRDPTAVSTRVGAAQDTLLDATRKAGPAPAPARDASRPPDAERAAIALAPTVRAAVDPSSLTTAVEGAARARSKRAVGRIASIGLGAVALVALVATAVRASGGRAARRPDEPPVERRADAATDPPRAIATRPRSSRGVLRVGIEALASLSSSYIANATRWPLAPTHSSEAPPVWGSLYLTRVPALERDTVQVADGAGFEVTWHLRHDLRWSDGHPLTAADVVLGYRVRGDAHVLEARALDPFTVVVRWDDRLTAALEPIRPLPDHALGAVYSREGAAAVRAALRSTVLPTNGPYRVAEFVPGVRTVLEANPHFPGAPPAVGRVEFAVGADEAALVRRFEAGELDMLASNSVSVPTAAALRARHPETVHIRPMPAVVVLLPDRAHPLLGQLAVRRALLAAIDRGALVRDLYDAHAAVMDAPARALPPSARRYGFDPAAAAAELRAAGARGATFPLYYARGNAGDGRIAERVRDDLGRAGVRVDVRPVDDVVAVRAAGRFDGMILTSYLVTEPPIVWWALPLARGVLDRAARDGAYDDEVAARVADFERAFVPERRAQILDDLLGAYSERLPTLPLVFPSERVVAAPSLRGWDQSADPAVSIGLEQWYFVSDGR